MPLPTQSVKNILEQVEANHTTMVSLPRNHMLAILREFIIMRSSPAAQELIKMDFIQDVTRETVCQNISGMLRALGDKEYPNLTYRDVLFRVADEIERVGLPKNPSPN